MAACGRVAKIKKPRLHGRGFLVHFQLFDLLGGSALLIAIRVLFVDVALTALFLPGLFLTSLADVLILRLVLLNLLVVLLTGLSALLTGLATLLTIFVHIVCHKNIPPFVRYVAHSL
jgi:hypothetical protein